nr:uncharacterized protein LOC123770336 [Procambarus clarkii]
MAKISNKVKARKAKALHAHRVKMLRRAALQQTRILTSEDTGGLPVKSVQQPATSQRTLRACLLGASTPPTAPDVAPTAPVVASTSAASTAADVASTAADAASTAADAASTAADVASTAADVASTAADGASTAADGASTAADVAGPSTSHDVLATPNISTKRKGTQSNATKRLKLFREEKNDSGSDSDSEVKCRINPRESVLMVTDKSLENYLDENYVCEYCSNATQRHTITIVQHDVKVTRRCSDCNISVTRQLMGNHENLISLVYSNMLSGHGYTYYSNMCSINRMKFVSYYMYNRIQRKIRDAANERWVHLQENTRRIIFDHYREHLDRHPIGGILDIDVSIDASWDTKGHHSQIGTAFVVEIFTGMVVDYNTFCKNCKQCQMFKSRKENGKITQAEFDSEMGKHLPDCDKNYDGTAKNMEADAAVLMWGRSQDNKLRYTTLVGDGDSSTFNKVCGMNNDAGPYEDVKVEKAEGINHFSKILATQLARQMSLVKGKGKLTNSTIQKLAGYFTKAIRDNIDTDWKQMRDACLSGLFHSTSTDEKPVHVHCPKGKDSWCFYQQDIANGKTPRSHKKMILHFQLPSIHMSEVLKIYHSLVSEENMTKCLKGKTQNPNESLHHRVWKLSPKDKYVGRVMVDFAMAVTAVNYNAGYMMGSLTNLLGLPQNDMTDWYFNMKDRRMKDPTRCTKPRKAPEEADPSYGADAD